MGSTLQWVIVALAVAAALAFVVRKYFPNRVKSTRQKAAIALLRNNPSGLQRRVGEAIAPPSTGKEKACETDCGGCD